MRLGDEIGTRLDALVEISVGKDLALQSINLGTLLRHLRILGGQSRLMRLLGIGELGVGVGNALLERADHRGTLVGYFNRDAIDGNRLQGHDLVPFGF